jgi:hypothetical protein
VIAIDEARERPGTRPGMQPLYLARIEDLRHGDLVKVDCAACHNVALLTPGLLLRLGLDPRAKVLDLKERVRCRGSERAMLYLGPGMGGGDAMLGSGPARPEVKADEGAVVYA